MLNGIFHRAILNNKVGPELQSHVTPAALDAGLPASSLPTLFEAITLGTVSALSSVPGMNSSIESAVGNAIANGYAAAYAFVYYAAVAIGAVGFIGESLLPR